MLNDEDRSYHSDRARAELDMAYRCENSEVANAHMRLASLHMARLRQEDEFCGGSSMSGR